MFSLAVEMLATSLTEKVHVYTVEVVAGVIHWKKRKSACRSLRDSVLRVGLTVGVFRVFRVFSYISELKSTARTEA